MHGRYLALRTAKAISWKVRRGMACTAAEQKAQSLEATQLAIAVLHEQESQDGLQAGEELEDFSAVVVSPIPTLNRGDASDRQAGVGSVVNSTLLQQGECASNLDKEGDQDCFPSISGGEVEVRSVILCGFRWGR